MSSSSSSSSATNQTNHALKYLETWVGNTSNTNTNTNTNTNSTNQQQRSTALHQQVKVQVPSTSNAASEMIQVTGSSYLLPTIRLPRSMTSSTALNSQLESFFDENNRYTSNAIRAMLKPKAVQSTKTDVSAKNDDGNTDNSSNKSKKKYISWRVPIILDLKAFQHDGSPHYKAPPQNLLHKCVQVLGEWGIEVIGVCNVQQDGNRDISIVEQVIELGLPVLMSKVGRTLGGTLNKNGNHNNIHTMSANDTSIGIEELVQIVTKHVESMTIPSLSNARESMTIPSLSNASDGEDGDGMQSVSNNDGIVQEHECDMNMNVHVTKDHIEKMSFRDLQKECKKYNLGARGSANVLEERLLKHHNLTKSSDTTVETMQVPNTVNNSECVGDNNSDNNNDNNNNVSECGSTHIKSPPAAKVYKGNVRSGQQITTDEVSSTDYKHTRHQVFFCLFCVCLSIHSTKTSLSLLLLLLYHKPNQSLIIIGNVSSGGELMSDHDIYIYGALRGRALAGLSQEAESKMDSKIFASKFDPELVCIGNQFTTVDSVQDLGLGQNDEGAMVSFDEDIGELKFTKF